MRFKLNIAHLGFVLLSSITSAFSQTIDQSFTPKIDALGSIYDMAQQSDGKLIIAGYFNRFNGEPFGGVVRMNTDGSIDNSFNIGVGLKSNRGQRSIRHIKIQPDGKILLIGSFVSFNGINRSYLVRLNSNGTVDAGFVPFTDIQDDNLLHSSSYPLILQPDGKILCVINVSINNSSSDKIARLNSDGSYDNTFNATVKGNIVDIQLQSDGKVLFAGSFTEFNGTAVKNIVRSNSDGSIENTFGSGADNVIYKTVVQSDGKIIVGGSFSSFNGIQASYLIRLQANGSIDNSFIASQSGRVLDLSIDDNGEIIAVINYRLIYRYKTNGQLDAYYTVGSDANDHVFKILPMSNGQMLIGGRPYGIKKLFLRLNSDFTVDASFNTGMGPTNLGTIARAVKQATGKIVLVGDFSYFNGIEKGGIVRLNEDLSVDNSFNSGTGCFPPANLFHYFMYTLNDEKIILCGQFSKYNETDVTGFIRLNSDGSLDNTYANVPRNFFASNRSTAKQTDNKLVIGGDIYNEPITKHILRLNTDGSQDLSFSASADSRVTNLAIQPDGKIVISGEFKKINGVSVNTRLVRLNSDGSTDETFEPESYIGSGLVYAVLPQSDGRLIIGGAFGVGGKTYPFRTLQADGKTDLNFKQANDAITGSATFMFQLMDNSILIRIGNTYSRVLPIGSLDPAGNSIELSDNEYVIGTVSLTPTTFLAYGSFTKLNSLDAEGLAKFTVSALPEVPAAPTSLTANAGTIEGYPTIRWTDNSSGEQGFIIQRSEGTNKNFIPLAQPGANVTTWTDTTIVSNVMYYYRVIAYNKGGMSPSSNEISFQGVITGLESLLHTLDAYPNPCTNHLYVRFLTRANRNIKLIDIQGISQKEMLTNEENLMIDMTLKPPGIYCLQVIEAGKLNFLKFVKQ